MPTQIKACLFDMDGTIINTEDLYTYCNTELLSRYGKGPLTWDVKMKVQGRPARDAHQIMIDTYQVPLTLEQYAAISTDIQESLWNKAKFLPGALELIQHLHQINFPIALGTSSYKGSYDRKTKHLSHGFDLFGKHIVTGDDPRIPKGRGKPCPDIWLACLDSLNKDRREQGLEEIKIEECLVFEDGVIGVESGIAANAPVVWIPHPEMVPFLEGKEQEIVGVNGEVLKSLADFDKEKWLGIK
ncbi:HAD-like protein [Suhomyces tanzawaensis NRRL Y-17324]|uniref:HAD-like protein n=1 Tax=Suhomyces tanzawaensis NRRL Y-17324 TaxID=984487 RepID=A0A1E4SF17_9ASCO|nr:HAD-like protein [Suhomyces tanzawaensis NRRL Y-17324]ODV78080.1 HAD-like protein [Suhomyces tanzawaensis NRRL Y-17324]